jgi:hypothetical protein
MRKTIELDDLVSHPANKADNQQPTFPTRLEISLVNLDDPHVVGLDTQRRFTIEHPIFGKLVCLYSPGQATSGTLASGFKRHLGNPSEILLCHNHALGLIHRKIKRNLKDAMEGLIREVMFETMRDLNGHAFIGELKAKQWKKSIKDWHASASGKRIGAHQGPQKDASKFVRQVSNAATHVKGRVTQEKLAEAMGITPRGLQQQIRSYRFAWSGVLDICRTAQAKRSRKIAQ